MRRMPLYYDPIYTDGIAPDARFPRERYKLTAARIRARGGERWLRLVSPEPIERAALLAVHDPAYVDAFLSMRLDRRAQRRIGLRPWTPEIVDRTLLLTGGSVQALDAAYGLRGYAGNMAGGTHHAFRDRGGGYCVFNDIAVCAVRALEEHGARRVAVVDLDVHQGDGTAAIFGDDDRVFTMSVHCGKNYPFEKMRSDLDIALPVGSGDTEYLDAVRHGLASLPEVDLVLFQAGVDVLADDTLGKLDVSHLGLRARNAAVFDWVDARGLPCVVFMGGGYGRPIDVSVAAFADLFLEAARRHSLRR